MNQPVQNAVVEAGPEQPLLRQVLWFGFFVALMFLVPPLVAMDLLVP